MNNPYEWLQAFIEQVPAILQPLIVAIAGAIPYIEGEGAAAFGIIAGINPIVAGIAGATGNILAVLGVVFLGSNIRERVVTKRATTRTAKTEGTVVTDSIGAVTGRAGSATVATTTAGTRVLEQPVHDADDPNAKPTRRSKGRARLRRWMVRFGVPGASILAPLALPTMLTAAFFVGTGVPKQWVILWQIIAIILWTGAVALAATGVLALLGW